MLTLLERRASGDTISPAAFLVAKHVREARVCVAVRPTAPDRNDVVDGGVSVEHRRMAQPAVAPVTFAQYGLRDVFDELRPNALRASPFVFAGFVRMRRSPSAARLYVLFPMFLSVLSRVLFSSLRAGRPFVGFGVCAGVGDQRLAMGFVVRPSVCGKPVFVHGGILAGVGVSLASPLRARLRPCRPAGFECGRAVGLHRMLPPLALVARAYTCSCSERIDHSQGWNK